MTAKRSVTTAGQHVILSALKLPEPPRFFDFTTETDTSSWTPISPIL